MLDKIISHINKLLFVIGSVICFICNPTIGNAQFAKDILKQGKFESKYIPSFQSPDGNYLYINDNLATDSVKLAKTAFFSVERIDISKYSEDSLKKMNFNTNELLPIGRLQPVQDIDALKEICSAVYIESFKKDKGLKTDKEIVSYFQTHRSFNDYGFWYNLIETRMALGLVYLDKKTNIGSKYLYFITRVYKDGKVEFLGMNSSIGKKNGNVLLPLYQPSTSKKITTDSALTITWKVPFDNNKIETVYQKKATEKDFSPIPFGFKNIRGGVYLQTTAGWEKLDLILPSSNSKGDTLTFTYTAKAASEKYYKLFLQIEDEVHNKGLTSDTSIMIVVSKESLPIVTKVYVTDTLNSIRVSWKPIIPKFYVDKIEISKSELNTKPTFIYVKPTDTVFIDYNIEVGKKYIYKIKTLFLPQTTLKQEAAAEGAGKFSVFSKPLPPSNLTASNYGKNILLKWDNDSIPGFYGFYIYRGTSINELALLSGPLFQGKFVDTANSLSGSSTYYYAVVSQNLRQQSSDYSNRVKIVPNRKYFIPKPAQIDFYYANKELTVSWDAVHLQDASIIAYLLQKKRDKDTTFISFPLIQNGINYHIDTNLLGGINYQYRVASINMTGDTSEFTDAFAYGVKKPDVSILNNFNVRNISEGIEVALPTVVFENRKYYRLYRKEEGENEYVNIGKIAADEFLFIDKKVVSNKYYTYSISVIDNEGREGVKCDAQSVKRD